MTYRGATGAFQNLEALREGHEALLELLSDSIGEAATNEAETASTRALSEEIINFIESAAATGSVLDEHAERTTARTLLDYWSSLLARAGLETPNRRLSVFDENRLPTLTPEQCPYVGLESFHESKYYFGREADISRLIKQLADARVVIIRGASGSGKSSLIFGGIVPQLLADAEDRWCVISMTPGRNPQQRLRSLVNSLADKADTYHNTLLVVDQCEEAFTLASEEDRTLFNSELNQFLLDGSTRRALLAIRDEFFARLLQRSGLAQFAGHLDAHYLLQPLTYQGLVDAIERPARIINLKFETGVVEKLVTDVLGQPAALPLLQYALLELWNRRKKNRVTLASMNEIGSALSALAKSADAFFESQIVETQDEIRRILVALVRVDDLLEPYRQPMEKSRMLAIGTARTEGTVELLAGQDFLRVEPSAEQNDEVIEIKHEALMRNWPMFSDWIAQKRRARRSQLALSQSAKQWERAGKPRSGLYKGWQLREALEFTDVSPLEREFLDASRVDTEDAIKEARARADENERLLIEATALSARRRRLFIAIAFSIVIIAVLAFAVAVVMAVRVATSKATVAELVEREREIKAKLADQRQALSDAEKALFDAEVAKFAAEGESARLREESRKARGDAAEASRKENAANTRVAELLTEIEHLREQLLRDGTAGLKFEAQDLKGKRLGITYFDQDARVRDLERTLSGAGMRVKTEQSRVAIAHSAVFWYYREDERAARDLAERLLRWLGVSVVARSKVGDPDFFGPGKTRPQRNRLSLYLAKQAFPGD